MREIKFRAWSKRNKVMKYTEEENGIFPNSVIGLSKDAILSDLFQPEWKIMQFTGLKDKNEKEIYEGDILKITRVNWYCPGHPNNDTDLIDQVEVYWDEEENVMSTRTFDFERLKMNPNQRPYSYSSALKNGWNDERADKNIWEIIGNIYENPELLKHDALLGNKE